MMRRRSLVMMGVLGAAALVGSAAISRRPFPAPVPVAASAEDQKAADIRKVAVWQPPAGLQQMPIWPDGAPDMTGIPQRPENLKIADTPDAIGGRTSEGVYDVNVPTMTVFPPKGANTGTAVVVFPGGGFQMLAVTIEGTEICDWLTARGITCILSKYRVPKSNDYYDDELKRQVTPTVPRALQDAQRTIRLVRSMATKLNVDPNKIGVMGFSAGGYLVVQTSNIFDATYKPVDAIDRVSSRPDFAIAAYPGHICRKGGVLDSSFRVTGRTPPTFIVQAWDDPVDYICNSTLYVRELDKAGVPSEIHIFAKGGHAFGLRRKERPLAVWPGLAERWLKEVGML
jgi:acetyl esterase/lipase